MYSWLIGIWLGIAPGLLFDMGIDTKEWWIFCIVTIILYDQLEKERGNRT